MPFAVFNCPICKREWTCPAYDYETHFKPHGLECNFCYSILAKQKYPMNLEGCTTMFSPMGNALGDTVIQEVVKRMYIKDNPDENVIFPEYGYIDTDDYIFTSNPTKIFWSDISQFCKRPQRKYEWFSVCNEASEYAKMGIYPIWYDYQKPNIDLPEKFIVLHLRNIGKCEESKKNVDEYTALKVIERIKHLKVLLIGNDRKYEHIETDMALAGITDLRWKLSLPEIAWICRESQLFIGHDSGMAHLAGASGAKLAVWGYGDLRWLPKVPENKISYLGVKESTVDNILNMICKEY